MKQWKKALSNIYRSTPSNSSQELTLTFDLAGMTSLEEEYIPNLRNVAQEDFPGFVFSMGCFVGECLIREYGGAWALVSDGTGKPGVAIGDMIAFPFQKVEKFLKVSAQDSLVGFFMFVPALSAKGWGFGIVEPTINSNDVRADISLLTGGVSNAAVDNE